MFEAFVRQESKRSSLPRRIIFVFSFALHGVLLVVAAVHSFWHVDELSPPGVPVTFVNALTPPPPPPPPPAAARAHAVEKATPRPKKPRPEPEAIVQPTPPPEEKPRAGRGARQETAAVESEGPSAPQGEPGGVRGRRRGRRARPDCGGPAAASPVRAGEHRAQRGSGPPADRSRGPSVPSLAAPPSNRPGMTVWGVFRICVAADGRVSQVTMLKSADPLVDNDWMAKMRNWQYRPYSVDGRPVSFCHPARIFVKSAN